MRRIIKVSLLISFTILLFSSCTTFGTKAEKVFRLVSAKESGIHFDNSVTNSKELNIINYIYTYNGGGIAVGDLNADGLDDIYFTANQKENKLYLNKSNFKFKDITEQTGTSGGENTWTTGVTFADVNGDGLLDIYVCQVGKVLHLKGKNLLYINMGNNADGIPQFEEKAKLYGLDLSLPSTHATFFDYDNDGDLDVYLLIHSNYSEVKFGSAKERFVYDPIVGDRIYRNDDSRFVDVTKEAGIYSSKLGFGLGVSTTDFNNDGYTDIYVGNDFHEDDYLYINNQDGTFTESLSMYFKHTCRSSMGNDIGDINNDGLLDVFSLDMLPEDRVVAKSTIAEEQYILHLLKKREGYKPQYVRNTLQLNRGEYKYSEIAQLAGVYASDWSWSPLVQDFDLDGLNDIFISNGIFKRSDDMDYLKVVTAPHIQKSLKAGSMVFLDTLMNSIPSMKLSNYLYKNNGDLTFSNMSAEWGLDDISYSNGAAYADLDNDGDLDLVVNNINQKAFLYENQVRANDSIRDSTNYIKIALSSDSKNKFGIGAKVWVYAKGIAYHKEMFAVRGYLSSMPNYLIFGLNKIEKIDSLKVVWPDHKYEVILNVLVNQHFTVYHSDASPLPMSDENTKALGLFTEIIPENLGLDFKHKENKFYELKKRNLLPRMSSTEGPKLAKADINNDGLEDIFVGGAIDQAPAIYIQTASGKFRKDKQPEIELTSLFEDVGAAFFDANGDKHIDLLVASGGNQMYKAEVYNQSRLFLNNGKGRFFGSNTLPDIETTASCIKPCDFDKDGDIDVFIGGRTKPDAYGAVPNSFLLENNGAAKFEYYSGTQANEIKRAGMIKDALWVDLDGDSWEELILVGEWMPVKIFKNNKGDLSQLDILSSGLQYSGGWWNCVVAEDFDKDGDMDLIVGNLGLNSKLKATTEKPISLYVDDFDSNGQSDPIITHFYGDTEYPFATRDEMVEWMPIMKMKYPGYKDYANAPFSSLLKERQIAKAKQYKIHELRSCYFENKGNNVFDIVPLPVDVQFSTVESITTLDFNNDGNQDLILAGNFYESNTQVGRYDASYGCLLQGIGNGEFESIPLSQSNLILEGQVRDLQKIRLKDGSTLIIAARNNDTLQVYKTD